MRHASSGLGSLALRAAIVMGALTYGSAASVRSGVHAAPAPPVTFVDITTAAGVTFTHNNGAFGKKYLPETVGSGVVFFDADGDGWPDLFLVNGKRWPGQAGGRTPSRFYKNTQRGGFADATAGSGLDADLYGIGAAAADYDNDGRVDLYVTALGGNKLFRNLGAGRFADVTATSAVGDAGFSTTAVWFDADADGFVDLFVGHYVNWSVATDLFCTLDGKTKSYCTPESYKGQGPSLYRNRGNGTFENVTAKSGMADTTSKSLGATLLDYDADGRLDLFVANDTEPNRLYRNRAAWSFEDRAVRAGVAFSEAGVARAGMGADAADYDGSGRPSLIIGNFSNQMMSLYHNEGNGLFIDDAPRSTVGRASLLSLTFGCFFFDYDLDGRPDIFAANGHVADDIERVQTRVTYAQRPHLFRNTGNKQFDEVSAQAGPALQRPLVARGAAYADIDLDGDLDLVIGVNGGPARVYRNDHAAGQRVIRLRLVGTTSNRDAIGARVEVQVRGGGAAWQLVKTGSSFASQSELPLTFGVGTAAGIDRVRVTWPTGKVETLGAIEADRFVTIREGAGMAENVPLRRGTR